MPSAQTPELVWRYVGQTKKVYGQLRQECEACRSVGLSVWERTLPDVEILRCWNHGPGMTGAECDGPKK